MWFWMERQIVCPCMLQGPRERTETDPEKRGLKLCNILPPQRSSCSVLMLNLTATLRSAPPNDQPFFFFKDCNSISFWSKMFQLTISKLCAGDCFILFFLSWCREPEEAAATCRWRQGMPSVTYFIVVSALRLHQQEHLLYTINQRLFLWESFVHCCVLPFLCTQWISLKF